MKESKRKHLEILRAQLEQERVSFISHWRDLAEYIRPRRARFTVTDVNRGEKRNQKIIDSTATLASRTLRSGMMAGITSPARPWKRLSTPDPALAEVGSVKQWLHTVDSRMSTVFLRSNLYNVLPIIYGDIGDFGTAAMAVEEDFDNVIRCYPFPIGSYMIANNDRLKVDVFFREFRMTVRQVVSRFGRKNLSGKIDWSNMSAHIKNLYDRGQTEEWIDVCHVIQPNPEFDQGRLESKHKRFSSCYYEKGVSGVTQQNYLSEGFDIDRYLSEKGYDYFPILCPRWEVSGEDVYGTDCPGMTGLGDIKALQLMHKRKAQAIEKMVNPPMTAPTALRNQKASILPADITYVDSREGQAGFRPAHEVNPRIQELLLDIEAHQNRINKVYYADLFLMLANDQRSNITAREIDERHEEKLLAIGPVLEQLNQDLLDPLIDITFDVMLRQGMIPEPPEELQGMDLKTEYISIMAQAQKLVGIAGIERFAGFANNVIAANPDSAHKIDTDQMLDVYADITSIPPGIVRSDEDTEARRQAVAQAQQAQAKAEMIERGAVAAKNLSQADLEGNNALTGLINQAKAGQLTPS